MFNDGDNQGAATMQANMTIPLKNKLEAATIIKYLMIALRARQDNLADIIE